MNAPHPTPAPAPVPAPAPDEGLAWSGLDLPRRNGEIVFEAPWQSTVFALASAVVENALDGDREPFRQQLIAAIAADPGRPYWESWTAALETLVGAL